MLQRGVHEHAFESCSVETVTQDKPIKRNANTRAPKANRDTLPPQDDTVTGDDVVASDAESSPVSPTVTFPPPE